MPIMLRIGGSILDTEKLDSTEIQIFIDYSMDISYFRENKDSVK